VLRPPPPVLKAERAVFNYQLGLATRGQLLEHDVTPDQVRAAIGQGRWARAAPGVYALANWPDDPARRILAACLATNGVASHASAAWLWGLLRYAPVRLSVTVHDRQNPTRASGNRQQLGSVFSSPRVTVHRSRDLLDGSVSTRLGVQVTNPLRTLVDMAADARPDLLDEAVDNALATRLVTVEGLMAEAGRLRRPGRRGPAPLLKCLEGRGFVGAPSPSVLESRALRLLNKAGIAIVRCEAVVDEGRYRLDIELEGHVFVEVDGYGYHWSPEQKSRDDARQNSLRLLGFKVLVYGWRDIVQEPRRMLAEIRKAQALTA
jgi:very-short-patch-repair endonuclease